MYYAFASFGRFVPPVSKRLGSHGVHQNALAFAAAAPTVVVLFNQAPRDSCVDVQIGGAAYEVPMKRQSFGALVVR